MSLNLKILCNSGHLHNTKNHPEAFNKCPKCKSIYSFIIDPYWNKITEFSISVTFDKTVNLGEEKVSDIRGSVLIFDIIDYLRKINEFCNNYEIHPKINIKGKGSPVYSESEYEGTVIISSDSRAYNIPKSLIIKDKEVKLEIKDLQVGRTSYGLSYISYKDYYIITYTIKPDGTINQMNQFRKLVNQTIERELNNYFKNASIVFQKKIINEKKEHPIPQVEDYGNWWVD